MKFNDRDQYRLLSLQIFFNNFIKWFYTFIYAEIMLRNISLRNVTCFNQLFNISPNATYKTKSLPQLTKVRFIFDILRVNKINISYRIDIKLVVKILQSLLRKIFLFLSQSFRRTMCCGRHLIPKAIMSTF